MKKILLFLFLLPVFLFAQIKKTGSLVLPWYDFAKITEMSDSTFLLLAGRSTPKQKSEGWRIFHLSKTLDTLKSIPFTGEGESFMGAVNYKDLTYLFFQDGKTLQANAYDKELNLVKQLILNFSRTKEIEKILVTDDHLVIAGACKGCELFVYGYSLADGKEKFNISYSKDQFHEMHLMNDGKSVVLLAESKNGALKYYLINPAANEITESKSFIAPSSSHSLFSANIIQTGESSFCIVAAYEIEKLKGEQHSAIYSLTNKFGDESALVICDSAKINGSINVSKDDVIYFIRALSYQNSTLRVSADYGFTFQLEYLRQGGPANTPVVANSKQYRSFGSIVFEVTHRGSIEKINNYLLLPSVQLTEHIYLAKGDERVYFSPYSSLAADSRPNLVELGGREKRELTVGIMFPQSKKMKVLPLYIDQTGYSSTPVTKSVSGAALLIANTRKLDGKKLSQNQLHIYKLERE